MRLLFASFASLLPLAGLWIIGLLVGIDMLLNGWSLVMLGLVAKNLPTSEQPA